jgi:hypothetical protein
VLILSGRVLTREGIEPPTRGFSARCRVFQGFINQPLAATCHPLPRHTKAQSWHTQCELVTFKAQGNKAIEIHFVVKSDGPLTKRRRVTWPNICGMADPCNTKLIGRLHDDLHS